MAHGGTLTINPQTGLPEAGFLDSLLPTLLGGAATYLTGGAITPMMAAMGVGGLTALTSKDLGKGLMAGLGAYGGGSIVSGLAEFGTGALSAEAGKAAVPSGMDALGYEAEQLAQNAVAPKLANASYSDRFGAGLSKAMSNPGDALSAIGGGSKFKGAAMLSAPLLSALSTQEATPAPTFQQTQFDPRAANINIRREQRPYQPDTGSSAQRDYFGSTYIDQYGADGGFVADGGIQHFASGGVPLDPNYDYSGYGRKKSTAIVPVVQPKALAKPDFVGADGKTYRYDPMKKSWYVIKDAPAKVNPGVEVLMGGEGGAGEFGDKGAGTYGGNSINAFTNSPLGAAVGKISNPFGATQPPAPVEDMTGTPVNFNTDPNTGVPDTDTNTGTTGMNTGTTGGSPAQAGDIGNPGGPSAAPEATGPEGPGGGGVSGQSAAPAAASNAGLAALANIQQDVAARAAAAGKTPEAFAEEGLAGIAAQAQTAADNAREASMSVGAPAAAPAPIGSNALVGGPTVTGVEEEAPGASPVGAPSVTGAALGAGPSGPEGASPEGPGGGGVSGQSSDTSGGPSGGPEGPGGGGVSGQSGEGAGAGAGAGEGAGAGAGEGAGPEGPGGDWRYGGMVGSYAQGGLGSLGGYSDGGRLLRGPGDGVSDHIPATIGRTRQPARLADGEFVVPARIVSELGNGSTEAGARALYKMMDRIQANRRKTTGKNSVAVDSKAHKYLPA
jgi:hypothetical protein